MAFLDSLAERLDRPTGARRWESPLDLAEAIHPATVRTPALELINEHLVWAAATPDARLIVSIPPQEGKSQLCSRVFPLWLLDRDHGTRIVLASYESGVARRLSRMARDDLTANVGALRMTVRDDVAAQAEWQVVNPDPDDDREGGVYAVGVGGALTSRPADVLIVDDPVKGREQADSPTFRERAWDWWTDTAATRLTPGAPVIIVLTRWHQDDLAGRLLNDDTALPTEQRQWRVLRIPAQAERPNVEQGIGPDPLGREPGEFMVSARGRTVEQWEAIRRRSARTWAALYQGRPAPAEGGVFQWAWIRPFRVSRDDVPTLQRVVVALDTTGGGHDEAGIIAAGRGADGRTYMLGDRSGPYTAGGQWRRAWMAVLDFEADELVYESNLVKPIMVKAARAAWRRLREQAAALKAAGLIPSGEGGVGLAAETEPHLDQLLAVARTLTGTGDDDVQSSDDPPTALADQLREVIPYAARVLDAPEQSPARLTGVSATRGKLVRAEPMAQAYETGQVSHVGTLPAYEAELVTWQEGQDSPNRLDAGVWAWVALNRSAPATASSPAGGAHRVPRGPAVGALTRRRR
jgi:hypothetical protein